MTRHEWLKRITRRFGRRGVGRFGLQMGVLFALGTSGAFASETGTNLPWEGPLTTLVTSLTGPVAYAISVIAIVALGATLAFAGGEMGETMKRLLHVGIAVCCVRLSVRLQPASPGSHRMEVKVNEVLNRSSPWNRLLIAGANEDALDEC